MSMMEEFKKFAFKGNVVDLAVGVVIGAAFGKIVSSLVENLIMPIVSLALPDGNWREAGVVLKTASDPAKNVVLKYGAFVGTVLDFLVVAFVLFLVVSKVVKAFEKKADEAPPEPTATEKLLAEIRDSLKKA